MNSARQLFLILRAGRGVLAMKRDSEAGFLMPTIIILIVVMSSIAYATLLQSSNSLNLAYKQSYIQMARAASKAAIDYAQEQFDSANCGAYSGTPETNLTGASNDRYRITMQAEVLSTSADGYEKKIVGTGRVYLPKTSSSALYVFDIRSEIVRTYAVCKSPDNFAPLLWLDASDTTTLKKSTTTTVTYRTTYGGIFDSTRDTLKERADNGSQYFLAWQSPYLDMHNCNPLEFLFGVCTSNATKYLNDGIIFKNVNIPKNSVINSANIQFTGAVPSGTGGQVTHRVYGFYKSSTNPHPDLFTSSGSNQVKTPLSTPSLHTTAYDDVSTNNFPPGNVTNFGVTNIVQEVVNNPNWNPTDPANGGRLGFALHRVSGNGSRSTWKDGIKLVITYTLTGITQANNTEALSQWDDISGNGNNAKFTYGSAPTRQDSQINSKTIVRFNNGALLSSLSEPLSSRREFTVFAVTKPNFSTSAASGRVISGMTTAGTDDTSGTNSIIPLRRKANASGFSAYYANSSSYEATMDCGAFCSGQPYLTVSAFSINTTNDTITADLRGMGNAQNGQTLNIAPGTPPPAYTFGIDQLYIGGRRTGVMPGSGADYFNGDYAEIVAYDKSLSCHEIEDLEEYFRAKWSLAVSQWTSTCPEDTVPTL